ncbi:rhomboid family intramembrane serine protease [Alloscardovia theropitheci]|uniref:Rhomboid family intramembrane serine protease n=1 Tax=Alloscardovia theropitheci TaxID=2496842 RepID=A0A4R0QQ04_9BIFI|nr:rhomboid family intramembrane serine protease [Alloscardovia theropitheci]TCD54343.1 rhomboid family intramembrane serine protease [Alloscardovia theropitheci]
MANPFTRGSSGPAGPWDPRNPNKTHESMTQSWQRFARQWSNNWRMNGPNITIVLIAINVVVFAVQVLTRFIPGGYSAFMSLFSLIPSMSYTHPWMLVTSGFLHANFLHILMNMLTLYVVGRELEKLLGHWAFLGMYMVSLLGGSVLYAVWPSLAYSSAVGASGAIYGLFGAMLTVYRQLGTQMRSMTLFLFFFLILPIFFGNIAWQAHIGGFITGAILSTLMMNGLRGLKSASINKRMAIYGSLCAIILIAVWILYPLVARALMAAMFGQ